MSNLVWDQFEVSEFFVHDTKPFPLEDDDGHEYHAEDQSLSVDVVILPVRSIVCVTIMSRADGHIVMDLSLLARSPLTRRRMNDDDSLYCHECSVLPGLRGYREVQWYTHFPYAAEPSRAVSAQLTCFPHIALRLYDIAHDNRALR